MDFSTGLGGTPLTKRRAWKTCEASTPFEDSGRATRASHAITCTCKFGWLDRQRDAADHFLDGVGIGLALMPQALKLPKQPIGREGVRVPKFHKAMHVGRIGAQLSSRVITSPLQFGSLPQIAQVAHE